MLERTTKNFKAQAWELLSVMGLLLALLVGEFSQANAADPTPAPSPAISAPAASSKNMASIKPIAAVAVGISDNVNPDEPSSRASDYTLKLGATYLPLNITGIALLSYSRELAYERDDGLVGDTNNAELSLSQKINIFNWGLSGVIPMSREAKRQTLLGASGVFVGVAKPIGIFTLSQTLRYSYSFFEYDIQDNGRVNSPHQMASSTGLAVEITPKLGLSYAFVYLYARSFQNVARAGVTSALSIDYSLSKNFALSFGIGNFKRSTLRPDGQGQELVMYDRTDAIASIELSASL